LEFLYLKDVEEFWFFKDFCGNVGVSPCAYPANRATTGGCPYSNNTIHKKD